METNNPNSIFTEEEYMNQGEYDAEGHSQNKRIIVLVVILFIFIAGCGTNYIINYNKRYSYNNKLRKMNKCIILIGDSYGIDYTDESGDGWLGWKYAFNELCPTVPCYSSAVGGSGFTSKGIDTFYMQLEAIGKKIDNPNGVTDIVVLGGFNDTNWSRSNEELDFAIKQFKSFANSRYKNAKISFMYVAVDYRNELMMLKRESYYSVFQNLCEENEIEFVEDANKILVKKSDIYWSEDDKNSAYHPSTKGAQKIATGIAEYLTTGKLENVIAE